MGLLHSPRYAPSYMFHIGRTDYNVWRIDMTDEKLCPKCKQKMKNGIRETKEGLFRYACWICPNNCVGDDNKIVEIEE